MSNDIEIRVTAVDTSASTLAKTKSNTVNEAGKIGDAASKALSDAFEQGVGKIDVSTPLNEAGDKAEATAKSSGTAVGKDFSAGVEQGAKNIDLGSSIAEEKSKAVNEAGQTGTAAGKKFADEFSDKADSGVKGKGKAAISGFGDEFKLGAAGIGAAAAGVLVSGFEQYLDMGAARSKLNKQLGLTGADAAAAGKIAGKVYADGFGEDAGGAADAVRAAVSSKLAKISDEGAVQKVAEKLSGMAATTGQEMDQIAKAASNLVKTGLAGNVNEALDLIAKGFTSLGPYSEDLLDTLSEYSVQFAQLGLDGPTALGAIAQMVETGLVPSTDKAADLFKELNLRVHATSDTTTDAFTKLGINQENFVAQLEAGGPRASAAVQSVFDKLASVKDPIERNRLGVELMGTQWEDTTGKINSINLGSARSEMSNTAGAAEAMGRSGDSAGAMFSSAMRQLNSFVTSSLDGLAATVAARARSIAASMSPSNFGAVMGGIRLGLSGFFADGGVTGGFATGGAASGISHRAAGGGSGGWTTVNERGPELVRLPSGSMVYPTGQSTGMLAGMGGGGGTMSIEINSGGSRLDDLLVEVLQKAIRVRGGNVQTVLGRG